MSAGKPVAPDCYPIRVNLRDLRAKDLKQDRRDFPDAALAEDEMRSVVIQDLSSCILA